MIDKSKIKPILDGQTGEEVATNMKANFDYIIDSLNNETSTEDITSVIAEALNVIYEHSRSLAARINRVFSGEEVVEKIVTKDFYPIGENKMIIVGKGAPSVKPDFIGQKYIDTTGNVEYTAYGNSEISDWGGTRNK